MTWAEIRETTPAQAQMLIDEMGEVDSTRELIDVLVAMVGGKKRRSAPPTLAGDPGPAADDGKILLE